jgi:hypothetical protein
MLKLSWHDPFPFATPEPKEIRMQRHVYTSTRADVPFGGAQPIIRDAPERLFPDSADDAAEAVRSREIEVHAGPVAIHDRFTIEFGDFEAYPEDHFCRLRLKCHGERHHLVLPDIDAAVEASDAGDERTELEIVAHYSPRLGALGALEDALVGYRAVEEAMTELVDDLRAALEATHSRTDATAIVPDATSPTTDDAMVTQRQRAAS